MAQATTSLARTDFAALTALLTHERSLLDELLYRQQTLVLMLSAGEHDHLPTALGELVDVESRLATADLLRAETVEALVAVDGDLTLDDVAAAAPLPVRDSLLRLGSEIRERFTEVDHRRRVAAGEAQTDLQGLDRFLR